MKPAFGAQGGPRCYSGWRDERPETIRLALSAAETGHLVFGTLHTSSAAKTVDRIVDVFPLKKRIWSGQCFRNP